LELITRYLLTITIQAKMINQKFLNFKDCRPSLSLVESGMAGKSKNRRTAERFKKFPPLLGLLINVNRDAGLQRKGMEIATFLQITPGQFSLLSY
jgi:hypothetical protein